jgi:hypothetical protein
MFSIKENYEQIEVALSEILHALDIFSNLEEIEIDGKTYRLEFFVGADLKFLAILYGINCANSLRPCIWCNCKKTDFCKFNKKFSLTDTSKGARTLSDAKRYGKRKNGQKYGHKYEPLINFVNFHKVVVDLLHLLLRITDRLMELLIADLVILDGNESQDLAKRPAFNKLVCFLENNLNLTNPTYNKTAIGGKKTIELRTFNGNEKLSILKSFNSINFVTKTKITKEMTKVEETLIGKSNEFNEQKFKRIRFIWLSFYELLLAVTHYHKNSTFFLSSFENENVKEEFPKETINKKLALWLKLFLSVYHSKKVTPYIHIFCTHVPEMLTLYNDIDSFNGQGIEGLNKKLIRTYHSSTNRQVTNKKWLNQALKNRCRKEYFYLNGWVTELDNNYANYEIDELDFGPEYTEAEIQLKQAQLDDLFNNVLNQDPIISLDD